MLKNHRRKDLLKTVRLFLVISSRIFLYANYCRIQKKRAAS